MKVLYILTMFSCSIEIRLWLALENREHVLIGFAGFEFEAINTLLLSFQIVQQILLSLSETMNDHPLGFLLNSRTFGISFTPVFIRPSRTVPVPP